CSPASRACTRRRAASPPWGGADRIPPRSASRPPSQRSAVTSTPTSTASIPAIRAACRARSAWSASPTRKCWNSLRSAPRSCRYARSSLAKPEDSDPHGTPPGTLICGEEEIVEQQVVTGIAFSKDEAQISIRRVQDKPGVAAAIFGPLAEASINVDMIVQNVSSDGATTDLTFTVPAADYERSLDVITKARGAIGYERLDW